MNTFKPCPWCGESYSDRALGIKRQKEKQHSREGCSRSCIGSLQKYYSMRPTSTLTDAELAAYITKQTGRTAVINQKE